MYKESFGIIKRKREWLNSFVLWISRKTLEEVKQSSSFCCINPAATEGVRKVWSAPPPAFGKAFFCLQRINFSAPLTLRHLRTS